ncbi:MAG: O-linked GlcNAc transferase-like protein [Clostridiales bacterium]|nr:O-linked GlcNAc transferase-like protein [Clostridiales bacterium]
MKIDKGRYGYRNHQHRVRLFITLLLAAAILAQLIARQLTSNSAAKNILTAMAILTVLPMANMASPLLAAWKYRTPPRTFYERLLPYEDTLVLIYDLIVTTERTILPLDAIAVHVGGVYAFCSAAKIDAAKAEKELSAYFGANHWNVHIKIFVDEHAFFRRLEQLKTADSTIVKDSATGIVDNGAITEIVRLLKNLSM